MNNYLNILVTGGGGFPGGAIVEMLMKRDHNVKSFSRSSYPDLDKLGVTQINDDISSSDDVDRAINGIDVVFHVAANPGVWGRYRDYYNINTLGSRNVVNSCIKHKVKHQFIQCSVYSK